MGEGIVREDHGCSNSLEIQINTKYCKKEEIRSHTHTHTHTRTHVIPNQPQSLQTKAKLIANSIRLTRKCGWEDCFILWG